MNIPNQVTIINQVRMNKYSINPITNVNINNIPSIYNLGWSEILGNATANKYLCKPTKPNKSRSSEPSCPYLGGEEGPPTSLLLNGFHKTL